MAVENKAPGAAQPQGPGDAPQAAPNANEGMRHSMGVETPAGQSRSSFSTITGYFNQGSVSPEIEVYLTDVMKSLTSKDVFKNGDRAIIRRVALQKPTASQAIIATDTDGKKYASLIIFADAVTPLTQNFMPISAYASPAATTLRAIEPGVHIVQAYVITNDDLSRSKQMAEALTKDLLPTILPDIRNLQALDLTKGYEYIVDHSLAGVQQFERGFSPHAVPPRMDFGFTVIAREPRSPQNMIGNQAINDGTPFLAVGGYVDVVGPIYDNQNLQKYQPVVRITYIGSTLPVAGTVILALLIAAQSYIKNRGWLKPFFKFAPGQLNLGNLTDGDDGKPFHITDPDVQDRFLRTWMNQPALALDVVTGQDRLPSLFLFENNVTTERLKDEIVKFFNEPLPPMSQPICEVANRDYLGYYGSRNGVMTDTRAITYLDQVAAHGALDPNTRRILMTYGPLATERAAVVSQQTGSFRSLFDSTTVLINGDYLTWASMAAQKTGLRLLDPNGLSDKVTMTPFSSAFSNYSSFQSPFQQQGRPAVFGSQTIFGP